MDPSPAALARPRDLAQQDAAQQPAGSRTARPWTATSSPRTVPLDGSAADPRVQGIGAMLKSLLRGRAPVLGFAASSAGCFVVDTGLFMLFVGLGLPTLGALAAGRALSSAMTFSVNRWVIFTGGRRTPLLRSLLQYAALVAVVLIGGMVVIDVLEAMDVPVLIAKVVADLVLFVLSYAVQRFVVFRGR